MSKTAATSALAALKKAIGAAESSLHDGERLVGSLQLQVGILLAQVAEVLGTREDLPTFKDWTAKNYAGRSYSSLNRWKIAGKVATILGYDAESDNLPTVEEMEPLNRVLQKAKDPVKGAERIAAIWASAQKDSERTAEAVVAGVNRSVGKKKTRPRNTTTSAEDSAGTVTVTVDPAEFEAQVAECKKNLVRMDKALIKKHPDLDPATVLEIRSQTLRLAGEWSIEATAVAIGVVAS